MDCMTTEFVGGRGHSYVNDAYRIHFDGGFFICGSPRLGNASSFVAKYFMAPTR
jgi:hypothetical protein